MQFYRSNETAITDSRHVSPAAVTIELNCPLIFSYAWGYFSNLFIFYLFDVRGFVVRQEHFTCMSFSFVHASSYSLIK